MAFKRKEVLLLSFSLRVLKFHLQGFHKSEILALHLLRFKLFAFFGLVSFPPYLFCLFLFMEPKTTPLSVAMPLEYAIDLSSSSSSFFALMDSSPNQPVGLRRLPKKYSLCLSINIGLETASPIKDWRISCVDSGGVPMPYLGKTLLSLYKPNKDWIAARPDYSWVHSDVDVESCSRRVEDYGTL